MATPRHIDSFQALRALFVTLIFLSHCPGGDSSLLPEGGNAGVSFFFLLSGFVLSYSMHGRTVRFAPFMRARLRRIYPVYLAALVAALPVMSWNFSVANLLTLLTLTQSWWPDPAIFFGGDSPAWFLSDLLFFYILFTLLYKLLSSASLRCALSVAGAAYATEIIVLLTVGDVAGMPWSLYVFPPARLLDFVTGMVMQKLFAEASPKRRIAGIRASVLQMFTVLTVAGAMIAATHLSERFTLSAIYLPVSAAVVLVWALTDSAATPLNRLMRWRPLQSFGAVSLEFYLLHVPVLVVVKRCISDHTAVAALAFALALAAACAMHRLFSCRGQGRCAVS